jgi:hypothetical protein
MFDSRAWRSPVVVGATGSNRRHPLSWRNVILAVEDFWGEGAKYAAEVKIVFIRSISEE